MEKNYLRQTPDGPQQGGEISLNSQLFIKYAEMAGWKVKRIPDFYGSLLTKGKNKHLLYEQTILTDHPAVRVADNKLATKRFLQIQGLPTPEGYLVKKTDSHDLREKIFRALRKPLVVKPARGTFGYKVYSEIKTLEDCQSALESIFQDPVPKIANRVVVEDQVSGANDYRLYCTTKRCLGVIHRIPAHVIGNGNNTIQELITAKNKDRIHKQLKLDDIALRFLETNKMTPDSIPKKEQQVFLRRAANTSAGGDCLQITPEIHQSLKDLAVKSVKAVPGLRYAGVDILTTDGTKDQKDLSPQIIELNHSPDIAAFYYPDNNKPFNIVEELLKELFPS
ncbi:hypothetical protein ACFL0Z_03060 [Patescibacteria group bacterium]